MYILSHMVQRMQGCIHAGKGLCECSGHCGVHGLPNPFGQALQ